MKEEPPPLPSWIIDHGYNRYSIDVTAAIAAGETLPIDLSKIPQFDKFWTNPPSERGVIYFENYKR